MLRFGAVNTHWTLGTLESEMANLVCNTTEEVLEAIKSEKIFELATTITNLDLSVVCTTIYLVK